MEDDRTLIARIVKTAQANGLNQKALALRGGLPEETLSRMKKRGSGNFAAVARLARAAGTRLGLVDSPVSPRHSQCPASFRDKYAVALAWSNKGVPDDVLMRRALVKPGFQLLLDAAIEFGVDALLAEWNRLKAEGSPEALKAASITERLLGHIHDGYRQTTG